MSAASCGLEKSSERKKNYLESSGRNNGSLRPASLIRHTIGDSIRKYQVREYEGTSGLWIERTATEKGYWRIRTRAIHYEYAGRKFCPINLSARFLLSCLFIERTLYLYPSIYPSAGMSESTNQALMHAKCAEEKLIVIHVPLPFSRVFQHGDVRPVSSSSSSSPVGKINSRMSWRGRINWDCCLVCGENVFIRFAKHTFDPQNN